MPLDEIILDSTYSKQIISKEIIQELWSGYGTLERVRTDKTSVIVKNIQFPKNSNHPKGWSSSIGHKRKVKSYQVEMNWYQHYGEMSPKLIASGEISNSQYLILEDLELSQFKTIDSPSPQQIKHCLKWLADFHKLYLHQPPKELWEVGTYWHLDTRPEELKIMSDLELKEAAARIDNKLNDAQFKTIVHGDAKLANFLFNNQTVAAVDFQYVGGGVGVKDVAYFLSSIYDENELSYNDEHCLAYYFEQLDNKDVEKEWRELYPYAWCDFYRFLNGWAPGHYKINNYSKRMRDKVLKWI